jgi:hypothetical protein
VPAPLPLCGAGMAFGYSRRLRRRLSLASTRGISGAGATSRQLGRASAPQASPPPRTGAEGLWCLLASS